MKQHSACSDLAVFDFKEEDEVPDTYHQWSKVANPKSEDHAMTKYQFLQYATTASVAQMKEVHNVEHVHIVTLDDDDRGFISDVTRGPLDLLENAGSKGSEGFDVISSRAFEQRCHFIEDNVDPKSSSPEMEIRVSSHFKSSPRDGLIGSTIPESPSSNGSLDAGTSDGHDSIQESPTSIPASPLDEKNVSRDVQAQDQSGLDMEEIVLHTDYVTYCGKYFPASLVLISKNSVKMKASDLEEESGVFMLEWGSEDIFAIESQWSSVANIAKVKLHVLTKDAVQAENAEGTSAVELLEFLVHDPDWSQLQECIMSLNLKYQAVWRLGLNGKSFGGDAFSVDSSECSSYPYIPSFEESFEEVVYPKGDVDAVSISKRDVDLLQPETFINDTIIDFYMKYVKNEIPPTEKHRFHFFNSFFFRKLADLDKNPSSAFDGKAAFQRVRKWTRKVDIFEKDYIFIPVNYNLHWSLIILCHPGEVANFNEENVDASLKVPCILHMDSIRGSHTGLKDLLQSYLLEEWKERQKDTSEDISSKFLNLRFLSLELPQQENCSDCGLFLLHYAELFISEAPVNFSPFMINKYENFLKPDWFMPAEASLKRVHIQRLIYELLEGHSQGSASPSCTHESHPLAFPEHNENDNGIEIISEKRSPGKSWDGNVSYSQSVQGIDMGLLDVSSLYRTSQCINDSGFVMRELIEQCQHYDQGASFGQLGCPMPSIREEVEDDEHLSPSALDEAGLQPMDELGAGGCQIDYSSRNLDEVPAWNSELSDQAEPDGNSSPVSNHLSDDSEEMMIIEGDLDNRATSSGQNENPDHSKENLDSLTESYASASSDMMETPAEDSQELGKIFGSNSQEDTRPSNLEEARQPSQQELDKNNGVEKLAVEDSSSDAEEVHQPSEQELNKNRDNGVEKLVVEDSSSDAEEVPQPCEQELKNKDNGVEKLVVEDSSSDADEEQAAKRIRLTPLPDEERGVVASLSQEL